MEVLYVENFEVLFVVVVFEVSDVMIIFSFFVSFDVYVFVSE